MASRKVLSATPTMVFLVCVFFSCFFVGVRSQTATCSGQCHARPPGTIAISASLYFPSCTTPPTSAAVLADLQAAFDTTCCTVGTPLPAIGAGSATVPAQPCLTNFTVTCTDTAEAEWVRRRLFVLAKCMFKVFTAGVTASYGLDVAGTVTTVWTSPAGPILPANWDWGYKDWDWGYREWDFGCKGWDCKNNKELYNPSWGKRRDWDWGFRDWNWAYGQNHHHH